MNFIDFFNNLSVDEAMDLIIALGIIVGLFVFSPLFSYGIIKIFNFNEKKSKIKQKAFYIPLRSFFRVLGIYVAIVYLKPIINITDSTMEIITKIFRICVILSTSIGLAKSINKNSTVINRWIEKSDKKKEDPTIKLMIRALKAIIYVIAGFMIIADLGYDLSGLVTGLGLGTVVLTLAAQDIIKNLLSGFMIILDKPFQVGDYIQFDKFEGTVVDITFRSTRIRTIEDSIAQVPNSLISNTTVTNISRMNRRRYSINLQLISDTDLNKIKKVQKEIEHYLKGCDIVIKESVGVIFNEITLGGYNVKAYCYLDIVNYRDFCIEKSLLNYGIMEIVQKNRLELL